MEHSPFLQTELSPKSVILIFLKIRKLIKPHKVHETLPSPKTPKIQILKKSFTAEFFWDAEVLQSLEGAEAPARPGLHDLLLNLG